MNQPPAQSRRPMLLAFVAINAAMLLGVAALGAWAQGPGGFGGGRGMMFGGRGRNSPLQANPLGMLQRPEVQNELQLDLNQKNAIQALMDGSAQTLRQQMQQAMQNSGFNRQNMRNMPADQRQQQMQQMRDQMQAARSAWQGELNDKIKAILKPDQYKRLHQLDLQYRGPLAMADPKVADEINLSQDHRTQIVQIATDDQTQQSQVYRDAFQQWRDQMQQNNGAQQAQRPQPPDFTSKLSPWKQKIDKIHKADEAKALGALSPDELAAWKAAIGTPFVFRDDVPQQQPGFGNGGFGGRGGGFGGRGGFGGGGFGGRGGRRGGGGGGTNGPGGTF